MFTPGPMHSYIHVGSVDMFTLEGLYYVMLNVMLHYITCTCKYDGATRYPCTTAVCAYT